MRECKKRNFISVFAVALPLLLREVGTRQIRHILQASTLVRRYAASQTCRGKWLLGTFQVKKLELTFLNGIRFSQSILMKKKASVKTVLPKSLLPTTEALIFFKKSRTSMSVWVVCSVVQRCRRDRAVASG